MVLRSGPHLYVGTRQIDSTSEPTPYQESGCLTQGIKPSAMLSARDSDYRFDSFCFILLTTV
jgi:hypothetical protein